MEYAKYNKVKYHEDPEFKQKCKEATARYLKKKYETDPEYKNKQQERMREHQRTLREAKKKLDLIQNMITV